MEDWEIFVEINWMEFIEESAINGIFEASIRLVEEDACCLVVNYVIIVKMPCFHLNEERNEIFLSILVFVENFTASRPRHSSGG
jgi:hypothetical protein